MRKALAETGIVLLLFAAAYLAIGTLYITIAR